MDTNIGTFLFVAAPVAVALTVSFVLETLWPKPVETDKKVQRTPKRESADNMVDESAAAGSIRRAKERKQERNALPEDHIRESPVFEMPADFELAEVRSHSHE